jgi:SAM-dependent methyltransferase
MTFQSQLRNAAKRVLGSRASTTLRRYFQKKFPHADVYRRALAGKRGLELGGPSWILREDGPLPMYPSLKTLDNCLYSSNTLWTGEISVGNTFVFASSKQPGRQLICDASDLRGIPDKTYECVLASHCLEHVANPLRALSEWKRVLTCDGLLLVVLPHKDGTFDWRRPTTTIAHMQSDFENNMGEDDLTHLPEILALHDLQRDRAAGGSEQFKARCLNNFVARAMHHHVFDARVAVALLDAAGLKVKQLDLAKPYHIILLAQKSDAKPDNSAYRDPNAEFRRTSPFATDSTS